MDFRELKNKSKEELQKLMQEQSELLRDTRFKIALKELKNIREVRKIKKTLARILTLLKGNTK